MSADQAFERLSQLYDELPAMEEKGAALARALSAQEIDRLRRAVSARKAQLTEAESHVAAAQAALERAVAEEASDEERYEMNRQVMLAGMERGYRIGPFQNAERDLVRVLEASPFASIEEAKAALMPASELDGLKQEVAAYQRDYAEALAQCQAYESSEEL